MRILRRCGPVRVGAVRYLPESSHLPSFHSRSPGPRSSGKSIRVSYRTFAYRARAG